MLYHPCMRIGNIFSHVCVCVSVGVCVYVCFSSLYLLNCFTYQGHVKDNFMLLQLQFMILCFKLLDVTCQIHLFFHIVEQNLTPIPFQIV